MVDVCRKELEWGGRKLVLEIAGRAPPVHLLRLVADRPRPPCNAGELQLQNWRPDLYDF